MSYKIFIDGASGTTGLKIHEYMKKRDDLEVLEIDYEKRHDVGERLRYINEADVTFLCLPDSAAREIAGAAPEDARIIDTSTAHRTAQGWTYGMPEISVGQRDRISRSNRVANPGCHATGAILLIKPLMDNGLLPRDYPFAVTSLTGYSGGGKNMIAEYEDTDARAAKKEENGVDLLSSPRQYGLSQQHKHIPEIMKYTGISEQPAFMPIVADYFSGMEVIAPVKGAAVAAKVFDDPAAKAEQEYIAEYGIRKFVAAVFMSYYEKQPLVHFGKTADEKGFIAGNRLAGSNELEISVAGSDENILLTATFDNLGKGASGAAVQNMNIMLGLEETKGLK
jgi:N-acetyl-gamma-glutamyl-phosphate reductase